MTTDFNLGDRVTFTGTLARRRRRITRYWDEVACGRTDGVVVGKRTLTNGALIEEYDDWSGRLITVGYIQREHFTAYLIAFDLRRKPVLVKPESIEKKGGT